MTDVHDLTLDEVRVALADGIASNAAFDGWGDEARDMAADAAGIDRDIARLAFKDGPVAMIDAWFGAIDAAMVAAVPREQAAAMKIRQRITALVEARLEALSPNREALRRALTILAMPQNAASGARLGWRTVDTIWAQAGDTATDYNHYTKRMTLGAVYGSTLIAWIDDGSEAWIETADFLDRRIDNVMQFEKWKAQWRGSEHLSLSRFLGRLRYPPR